MPETPSWDAIPSPVHADAWVVAHVIPLAGGDSRVDHIHPIEFADKREADRAAVRLNDRDSRLAGAQ